MLTETLLDENIDLPDTKTGFSSPQVQITVELRIQRVFTLQIGKTGTSGHYYARLQNEPDPIFLINAELIQKLKTKLEWLRTTEDE